MTQLRTVAVDDYRRRKKKGGPLRALSSKAWSTDDFFAGLREVEEDAKAPEEVAKGSDDDSDWGLEDNVRTRSHIFWDSPKEICVLML